MPTTMDRSAEPGRRSDRDRAADGERGQVLVLFALVLVAMLGFASLALDVGRLRLAEQDLWNALDAGALAGVGVLPSDPTRADSLAHQYLDENYPGTTPVSNPAVSFRCLIGSVNGAPRLTDVPRTCDPGPAPVTIPLSDWTCNNSVCTAVCEPALGDTCNTIVVAGEVVVPYSFGRVVGVNEASTGTVTAAACKGPCGAPPEDPVDLVVILDRTQSMNGVDTANARNAAQSVRKMLNPSHQWLGYSFLGPSQTASGCVSAPAGSLGAATAPGSVPRWVPVGLTGQVWQGHTPHVTQDFAANGSNMDNAIACYSNSSVGTDLTDPIPMAVWELNTYGRPGVPKGIIMMTDGQPNAAVSVPSNSNYCKQAEASAAAAKAAGIEMFTIAFGLDGANDPNCPDGSGSVYQGRKASRLVADMATPSSASMPTVTAADLACGDPENGDDDHYFCVPKTAGASADLTNAFRTATAALVGGTKLVHLP